MNNDLNLTNPSGTFVTSIIGRYNLKTDEIELANAGHQPALVKTGDEFIEYSSSSTPLGVMKQKNENVYKLEKFKLNSSRVYCFTDGFSESLDENKNEIGINGVKELLKRHQNSKLKIELQKVTEEIRQKSLKKEYKEKGLEEDKGILDDDLTILGIGK
tara:strand:- start:416 stop:892 length:477 start_codon:yes stop_codon:yes gene_type:complete